MYNPLGDPWRHLARGFAALAGRTPAPPAPAAPPAKPAPDPDEATEMALYGNTRDEARPAGYFRRDAYGNEEPVVVEEVSADAPSDAEAARLKAEVAALQSQLVAARAGKPVPPAGGEADRRAAWRQREEQLAAIEQAGRDHYKAYKADKGRPGRDAIEEAGAESYRAAHPRRPAS